MAIAVLASGTGSNLGALLAAAARGDLPPIRIVLANVACQALERAAAAGVPGALISHRDYANRDDFDAALAAAVRGAGANLVCLAGFLRILGPAFLEPFHGRVVNVHPSLLPSFPGLHAQRQALAAGVRIAGCSVHFVDSGTDTGALIAQAAVPVLPDDSEATLSARILAEEHRIFPAAAAWVASGAVELVAGRAVFRADVGVGSGAGAQGALHSPEIGR